MSAVGPELPPHLFEKRKRPEDDDASDSRSDSSQSSSLKSSSKRQRTIGPTLPPAPLDERPPSSSQPSPGPATKAEDTSSDDDEFGPVLPTSGNAEDATSSSIPRLSASADPAPPAPSQRDAWMLVPPSSGDWSARIDPTKLKARKFNTSKSSSGPKDTSSSAADTWNETPQEKHARLQREMMGIKDPSTGSVTSKSFKHQSKKDKNRRCNRCRDQEEAQRLHSSSWPFTVQFPPKEGYCGERRRSQRSSIRQGEGCRWRTANQRHPEERPVEESRRLFVQI